MASNRYTSILKKENYIAGKWSAAGTDKLTVLDKYTGSKLAELPMAKAVQMEQAIAAAAKIKVPFSKWSAAKRQEHLEKLVELLKEHRDAFVDLIVKEGGKPLGYAQNEVDRSLFTLKTAAAEAIRFCGEVVPLDVGPGEGKTAFTKRIPIGVIAGITPFNFPLNLVLHKVAPALALGCPIILKPAPQAPLTALAFTALIEKAGYPAGVVSTLVCDNSVAEKLVRDERIAMLSFTGSDKVGWFLKSICGKKKVALELGGNASLIVDENSDLEKAAKQCAVGAYIYAGQTCISTQRIFVVGKAYEKFKPMVLKEIAALKTGDPSKKDVVVGPIIDAGHLQRISDWVEEAKSGGAKVLAGGKVKSKKNNTYEPTLLTDVKNSMKVNCAEVFGPVATIEKVKDFKTAIARTNDSVFGLQAGVFTNDLSHMMQAHDELEVGGIIINNIPGFRVDSMPYGGIKDSGLGREGLHYAMEEMTEPRLLVY